jgi:hypothetical protein
LAYVPQSGAEAGRNLFSNRFKVVNSNMTDLFFVPIASQIYDKISKIFS